MREILEKLKQLTGKEFVQLTERGNRSIQIALALAKELGKTKVLIQDQGGWMTFKNYPKKFDLEIKEVKTNQGLIDLEDLEKNADSESILLICSMPGYLVIEENIQKIQEICAKKGCLFVNDISGSIGTDFAKYGDLVLSSFGKWKPVNLKYGGFIATNDKEKYTAFDASFFDDKKYEALIKKLEELPSRLKKLQDRRKTIIEDLESFKIIHKDKSGINVCVKFDDDEAKQRIIDYCKENKLEFTECPRYIRVNENAISVEIKRL
jgi:DNA-binding transcriptional MocR family regulator